MDRKTLPWLRFVEGGDSSGGGGGTPPPSNAETPPEQPTETGKTFTQADLDRVVADRLARERAKHGDIDKLKKDSQRLADIEAASKTEAQRAADELAAAKAAAEESAAAVVRYKAAAAHGITGDDLDLVGAGDEGVVMARAERLGALLAAERELAALKDKAAERPAVSNRPVPGAWHPGATPVDVKGGPSAKDRAAAAAQQLGWVKPAPTN